MRGCFEGVETLAAVSDGAGAEPAAPLRRLRVLPRLPLLRFAIGSGGGPGLAARHRRRS
jgi:hypothetical protein